MRFTIPAVVAALLLASGPAVVSGGSVEFPTLTWPVTLPAPGPAEPAVNCTDTSQAGAALCRPVPGAFTLGALSTLPRH